MTLIERLRHPVTPTIYSVDVDVMRSASDEIERLQKIEAAAKNLMHYNLVGAPDWAEWDRYFDELNEVLKK